MLGKSAAEAQALRDRGVVSCDRSGAGLTLSGCTCPQCGQVRSFRLRRTPIKRRRVIHDACTCNLHIR